MSSDRSPISLRRSLAFAIASALFPFLPCIVSGDGAAGSPTDTHDPQRVGAGTVQDMEWLMSGWVAGPDGSKSSFQIECKAARGGQLRLDVRQVQSNDDQWRLWPGAGSAIVLSGGRIMLRNGCTGAIHIRSSDRSPEEPLGPQAPDWPTEFPRFLPYLMALANAMGGDTRPPDGASPSAQPDSGSSAEGRPSSRLLEPHSVTGTRIVVDPQQNTPRKRQLLSHGDTVAETEYLDRFELPDGGWGFLRTVTTIDGGTTPVVRRVDDRQVVSSVQVPTIILESRYSWDAERRVLLLVSRSVETELGDALACIEMTDYRVNTKLPAHWFYIPAE